MKRLQSKEITEFLGKSSFWFPNALQYKVEYISGVDFFDEVLKGKTFQEAKCKICIYEKPKGLQIEFFDSLYNSTSAGLIHDEVISVNLEDKEQVFEKKDKSVVGRALVGGLLFGPVGAIVGAATGLTKSDVKKEMPDLFLSITYLEDRTEKIILFSCKYSDKKLVDDYFSKIFKDKYQKVIIDNTPSKLDTSKIDEIQRLFDLKEKGAITQEEFINLKKQLLG